MSKFRTGDEVYNEYGHVARYVMPAEAGGHIVEPLYENDEDEEASYGRPEAWIHVFAKPTAKKLDQGMADIQAAIDKKRQELRGIQDDIYSAERERKDLLQRIKATPDLTDLDMWLQGKVTHIVTLEHYQIGIGAVEETLRRADRERHLRLLNLMVDPMANHFWVGYASYSDGSGSQTRCLLATSLEHARALAAEYVANEIRKNPHDDHSSLIMSANELGVSVPADRLEAAQQKARKNRDEQIIRMRRELERQQENLRALEAQQ